MHQTFTPNLSNERIAKELLFLFEIMPDDFIYNNGISPSHEIIQRIKQSFQLNSNHPKNE
jgi:hypothetical protein